MWHHTPVPRVDCSIDEHITIQQAVGRTTLGGHLPCLLCSLPHGSLSTTQLVPFNSNHTNKFGFIGQGSPLSSMVSSSWFVHYECGEPWLGLPGMNQV